MSETCPKCGELRPKVLAFARLMERRLKVNDHKGGWKSVPQWWLMLRAHEEMGEFLKAWMQERGAPWTSTEAADAANFLMMLLDVRGELQS